MHACWNFAADKLNHAPCQEISDFSLHFLINLKKYYCYKQCRRCIYSCVKERLITKICYDSYQGYTKRFRTLPCITVGILAALYQSATVASVPTLLNLYSSEKHQWSNPKLWARLKTHPSRKKIFLKN